MDEKYKDEEKPKMSWDFISRRDLLKKGIAFSAVIPLLPVFGTKEVFAAEKERSGDRKNPYADINYDSDLIQDMLDSCRPYSDPNQPNGGCSQCATTLKSSTISAGSFTQFLYKIYKDGLSPSDLSQVFVQETKISDCGDKVADASDIVKDSHGNIVDSQSSGYCSAPVSDFNNNEFYRVQWIISSYLECLYGVNHKSAMWMAWFLVGKPDYYYHA